MSDNPFGDKPQPQQPMYPNPPQQESVSALDAVVPTNPFAFVSCYAGILSIICCLLGALLGPIAIVTGVIGLKKWKVQESTYGETTSKIRIGIGIVTGIIGTLGGIVAAIMFAFSLFTQ